MWGKSHQSPSNPIEKPKTNLKVSEPERLALRGVIGSLQYAAINTRPDLSSRLSMLQSNINSATIETLQEANKLLHEAKKYHDMTITIRSIPQKAFRFMAFSDASFSSASKPDSHAGLVIVGTHENILKNQQCPISPISWGCRKIQKVVTSTFISRDDVLFQPHLISWPGWESFGAGYMTRIPHGNTQKAHLKRSLKQFLALHSGSIPM